MKSKTLFILLIVCVFTATNVGAITLTAYNSRASWEAAVGGLFIEENLNSFTSNVSYESSAVDVGDFSVSLTGTIFSGWHTVGPQTHGNDVNGTGQINGAVGSTGGTMLDFDFDIMAFGADWDGISDGRVTNIRVAGAELSIPNLEPGFFGFVADEAFSSELLFLFSGPADGFAIDNVVYSEGTPIPEPATMILLGLGIIGIAGVSRKKLKK